MGNVLKLNVNGASRDVDADSERPLLSVLRDDLDLTGAKYGCGEGKCGACTVLVDGEPVRSCITSVGDVSERRITTIEGLERDGKLHPVQEAFLETGALQCGYCTCGMILSAVALLAKSPEPARDETVKFLSGNVCRCGTYNRVLAAVSRASSLLKEVKR
jgi:aerobic-type carbon monoxide dehydrogenase small subunit (CoxS/CutS family)